MAYETHYWTRSEIENSPSFEDDIANDVENLYRFHAAKLIKDLGEKLGVPYKTWATGITYFHRFYMKFSFKKFNKYLTAAACLLTAGKAEETPKQCRQVLNAASKLLSAEQFKCAFGAKPEEELIAIEKLLQVAINFEYEVDHPFKYILKYGKTFLGDDEKKQEVIQQAWGFCNDSLYTTLCLEWEPQIVAIACLHLASETIKFTITHPETKSGKREEPWWNIYVADLTVDLVEGMCQRIRDTYSKRAPRRSLEDTGTHQHKRAQPRETATASRSNTGEGSSVDAEYSVSSDSKRQAPGARKTPATSKNEATLAKGSASSSRKCSKSFEISEIPTAKPALDVSSQNAHGGSLQHSGGAPAAAGSDELRSASPALPPTSLPADVRRQGVSSRQTSSPRKPDPQCPQQPVLTAHITALPADFDPRVPPPLAAPVGKDISPTFFAEGPAATASSHVYTPAPTHHQSAMISGHVSRPIFTSSVPPPVRGFPAVPGVLRALAPPPVAPTALPPPLPLRPPFSRPQSQTPYVPPPSPTLFLPPRSQPRFRHPPPQSPFLTSQSQPQFLPPPSLPPPPQPLGLVPPSQPKFIPTPSQLLVVPPPTQPQFFSVQSQPSFCPPPSHQPSSGASSQQPFFLHQPPPPFRPPPAL